MSDLHTIAREEADRAVEAHEAICAERYKNLQASFGGVQKEMGMLWRILAWAGSTTLLLILGLLGFLAKVQFDSMNARDESARQIVEILKRQPSPPQVVVQPAPGSPEMGATVERQQP